MVTATQNESDPHFTSLKNKLSILNEKNPHSLNSFIVDSKQINGNPIFVVASTQENNKYRWTSLSSYQAQEEFMEIYQQVLRTKKPFISEDFSFQGEKWITALSPITNENGEIIAVLGDRY